MKRTHILLAGLATIAAPAAADAAFVSALAPTPTLLGTVVAGQTYRVTTTGIADLFDRFDNFRGLTFTADGLPTYAFAAPYSDFFPNGLDYDPSQNVNAKGVGGAGKLIGSLLGTFTATPTGPADYFTLGLSYQFTATQSGALYGVINDVASSGAYADNGEGYTVDFAAVQPGVPEPASWALMILGFGAAGVALRRRPAIAFA